MGLHLQAHLSKELLFFQDFFQFFFGIFSFFSSTAFASAFAFDSAFASADYLLCIDTATKLDDKTYIHLDF